MEQIEPILSKQCGQSEHHKCDACECLCHTNDFKLSYAEAYKLYLECQYSWFSRDDLTAYNAVARMRDWLDSF